MKLAIVIGQVVSTVKHAGFEHDKLLLVEIIDGHGKSKGNTFVAADTIGAGNGEWVLLVEGSSARKAGGNTNSPVDMTIVGIVDEVVKDNKVTYHK